jgi:hypothetical protein
MEAVFPLLKQGAPTLKTKHAVRGSGTTSLVIPSEHRICATRDLLVASKVYRQRRGLQPSSIHFGWDATAFVLYSAGPVPDCGFQTAISILSPAASFHVPLP